MKVTIEIDTTPREMRTLMGLPDIEPVQQEMIEKIREKTLAGIESSDTVEIMRLFMPTADQFKSMEALQTSFWQSLEKGMNFNAEAKDKE